MEVKEIGYLKIQQRRSEQSKRGISILKGVLCICSLILLKENV